MDSPICDFVKKYCDSSPVRLHMPGHKGVGLDGLSYGRDITEVDGADVLYGGNGIIKKSQDNASKIFGTKKTIYSAEGSSLSIRAMVYLVALYAAKTGKRPLIVATRNAHKAFVNACAVLGVDVVWAYQKDGDILSNSFDNRLIEALLDQNRPVALYVTSPDYLGNLLSISALRDICDKYSTLLLVDNAHGAYLNFIKEDLHPIKKGAHICCDSAHKTLPVLTGGGYLHFSVDAPDFLVNNGERAMGIFASTSPSYLIMQSLDAFNKIACDGFKQKVNVLAERCAAFKDSLKSCGFITVGEEPLKITLAPKSYGYTGEAIKDYLLKNNIVCEFSDPDYVVMMVSPSIDLDKLDRLEDLLKALPKREPILSTPPILPVAEVKIAPHKAILMPAGEVDVRLAKGRVLASPTVNCPPAVPILVCGEVVTNAHVDAFLYYGINTCFVVDEGKI